jgi:hypothetical protein
VGGPGLDFETWVLRPRLTARKNPGLKIETWATHSRYGGQCLFFRERNHGLSAHPRRFPNFIPVNIIPPEPNLHTETRSTLAV